MTIHKITGETCKTTRPLWEEVFYEDSIQFTDYYFDNKVEKNIGYVLGQAPYDAMMFRTPYTLQIGEVQKEISYIVGVATRKECRHRGYMRELLMHSFREMYQEKNPFTFLMPANPAIYEPFDFKYIYERDVWQLKESERAGRILGFLNKEDKFECQVKLEEWELRAAEFVWDDQMGADILNNTLEEYGLKSELNGLYSVRSLRNQFPAFPIFNLLAEFANGYLKEHYNIYVHRDASYYEMQLKESEAQDGDIYVWFEQNEIKAFFLYAREGEEIFLQEVMEEKEGILEFLQKAEKKKPIIMARIIHLEEMMKLVCSKENTIMVIEIEDELIPENTGIFRWEMTPKGSLVTRISSESSEWKENKNRKVPEIDIQKGKEDASIRIFEITDIVPDVSMHIRDFAPWVLTGVFMNEIV